MHLSRPTKWSPKIVRPVELGLEPHQQLVFFSAEQMTSSFSCKGFEVACIREIIALCSGDFPIASTTCGRAPCSNNSSTILTSPERAASWSEVFNSQSRELHLPHFPKVRPQSCVFC